MRDVIQVERAGGPGGLAELARVADELLPPLVARLGVSELGEIEVRHGDWRVRIRRAPVGVAMPAIPATPAAPGPGGVAHVGSREVLHGPSSGGTGSVAGPDEPVARATAVGYFGIRSGLAVGHRVAKGDVVGWVDVLGVRREIVAPADGAVSRILVEPGDPVEYGQELLVIIVPPVAGTTPAAPTPPGVADAAPASGATIVDGPA